MSCTQNMKPISAQVTKYLNVPPYAWYRYGYFAELGPYRLTADSLVDNKTVIPAPSLNPYSWDHLSNVVIFEHPPGTGFSYCTDEQGAVVPCKWNDQTQAVAFYETLLAFYKKWDEFKVCRLCRTLGVIHTFVGG